MSILVKNVSIICSDYTCLNNAFLGIEGDTIDYVGQKAPLKQYTEEKDMSGKLLLPGFVNSHGHPAMVQLRGIGSGLPLQDWLNKVFAIEDQMAKEDYLAGVNLSLLEMISSGTTCFSDMYMYEDFCAESIGKSGIKANLSRGFCGGFDEDYRTSKRRKESLDLFNKYNGSFNDRLRIDFSIHAEYTTTECFVQKWADEVKTINGARMQLHLSETKHEHEECIKKYGRTPTQFFASNGVFDIPSYVAHCVWATDDDLDILKKYNVGICHCPESNLKLGSGIAPVEKFLAKGIAVGLGTDGAASNNNLNMMEEMHTAAILHNGLCMDSETIKPEIALKMATRNGAIIMGRDNTGVLEVGKKADIIAIDMDKPHLYPQLDKLALVVYSAQASDVCMTIVDGKILYENGEFKTLDREKIIYESTQSANRLYR